MSASTPRVVSEFFAYKYSFRGGVRVATADTTGDGRAEIITGAGPGGSPHIRIFDANHPSPNGLRHAVVDEFYAYRETFRGGVYVAAGELNADASHAEIVTGAGEGGGPHVKVWSETATSRYQTTFETSVADASASYRGGVRVSVGNPTVTNLSGLYFGLGSSPAFVNGVNYSDSRFGSIGFHGSFEFNASRVPIVWGSSRQGGLVIV